MIDTPDDDFRLFRETADPRAFEEHLSPPTGPSAGVRQQLNRPATSDVNAVGSGAE
jgi:hypothetical protein